MNNRILISTTFILLYLSACSVKVENNSEALRIAISKAVPEKSYENYIKWLRFADTSVIYFEMYHLDYDSALLLLKTCDGLLLTGGTDIYPGRYEKESDTSRCWKPDFKRDTMEVNLLTLALANNIPVMGICRGHQLINVHLGGSLYIDIPTDIDTIIKHQLPKTYECIHEVKITEGSLLQEITGLTIGEVNSNHHQGIEIISNQLNGIAKTNDGLIESTELKQEFRDQFLLGVQWHPERMDYTNPLSGKIAHRFINEAQNYRKLNKHK